MKISSQRERTLWILVIVIILAIYLSLGYAGEVAGFLRQNGLLESTFMLCALIIAAAIGLQWLKGKPKLGELWVVLGVGVIFLLAWLRV